MLSKIEELEIRVGELVKENYELREAGERLSKENIEKHFALKKHAESNYKLTKENEALKKELKEQKETLRCIRQDNQELRAKLFRKKEDERLDTLEKSVAYLEERLEPKEMRNIAAEEKLEVGKWYHTTDFTKEELTELLPNGTTVLVEKEVLYNNIEKEPPTKTTAGKVLEIAEVCYNGRSLINIGSPFYKEWFKIIEED